MITTKLIFDRRGWCKTKKKGIIEVRVTFDRKTIYISTGVCVRKGEWAAGQIVNRPDASILNNRIIAIYERVSLEADKCVKDGHIFETESIKQDIGKIAETYSSEPVFIKWVESQIPLLKIKSGTRTHYNTLLMRLIEYNQMNRWQDVTIENIVNFDSWLHQLRPKPNENHAKAFGRLGNGLSDGAIYNYHKCLKALLRRADMFGKIDRNPYERLRGQFARGDKENVEYLTEDEMQIIMDMELPEDSQLTRCRDLFVFQMWTGLSYSDAEAFDISQYKNVKGKWVNVGERIKTGVPYVSQLLPPVVDVLKKYDWKTPQIENHVYNRMLKAIGAMAKIETKLHSHLARHSFATYMLSKGTRIEHVGKMLGQTNVKTTQRYAKVLAQDIHKSFDNVAAKMENPKKKKNVKPKK